jgi:hypothetical protein
MVMEFQLKSGPSTSNVHSIFPEYFCVIPPYSFYYSLTCFLNFSVILNFLFLNSTCGDFGTNFYTEGILLIYSLKSHLSVLCCTLLMLRKIWPCVLWILFRRLCKHHSSPCHCIINYALSIGIISPRAHQLPP